MIEPDAAPWWAGLAFAGAIAAAVLLTLAFPLYQAWDLGGFVYYVNAYDESTYLQYDFSRAVQGIARPGQFLVSLAHEAGLSGGWINVLSDLLALILFPLLAWRAFLALGWPGPRAMLGALAMAFLPALVGTANPLVAKLHDAVYTSWLVSWINVPEMFASPLVRSPEPQFSLTLLALGVWLALRRGATWPVYLTLPFMYPFVALPAAFVVLALDLRARWPGERFATVGPLVTSYVALGVATFVYYSVLAHPQLRTLMIDSRLPLATFTGTAALALYTGLHGLVEPRLRFFALALALSPWVASNQQLFSGHIPQPNNFEHYFGVFACAAIATLALAARPRLATALVLVGFLAFARTGYVSFRANMAGYQAFKPDATLISQLRDDPGHVVVNDGTLAGSLSMLHPRQHSTALGFEQTFVMVADRNLARYRCTKAKILADMGQDQRLVKQLAWMDDGFMYGSQNVIVSNIGRKPVFPKLHDVSPEPCADSGKLVYVWIR